MDKETKKVKRLLECHSIQEYSRSHDTSGAEKESSIGVSAGRKKSKLNVQLIDHKIHAKSTKELLLILNEHPKDKVGYVVTTGEWVIDKNYYISTLRQILKRVFDVSDVPDGVLKYDIESRSMCRDIEVEDSDIFRRLFPFQKAGVRMAVSAGGKVLIADEMGLGKTIQSLAIAVIYKNEWPLTIIAPGGLLHDWKDNVSRFLGLDVQINDHKKDNFINILSYETAQKSGLASTNVFIVDECHYLKSRESLRSKRLVPILKLSKRVILLSGTPATSRPIELYNIFRILCPSLLPNYTEYGMRYCNGRIIDNHCDFRGSSNCKELNGMLQWFMIRRTKKDVMDTLPEKHRSHVTITCISEQDKQSEESEDVLLKKFQLAAASKVAPVKKYLNSIVSSEGKFIIFAYHVIMMDEIESYLKEKGLGYTRIDGKTPNKQRNVFCKRFQTEPSVKVALLSLATCATGLNLVAAKMVIFAELFWNPGILMQAENRVHRIGQTENVKIIYLVCQNTIDDIIWPMILKKLNILEKVGISENELNDLSEANNIRSMLSRAFKKKK